MQQSWLELRDIECRYRDQAVVHKLSLKLNKGDLICLVGPSGCGKSTVLRAIAGLEPITSGEVILRGKTVSRPGFSLPPEKRRLGMVFQDHTLFPFLNVRDNICFGLRHLRHVEKCDIASRMLNMLDLGGLGSRYPHELSGGQLQRAALARALAPRPDLLLLDEPFTSLDAPLRERLTSELADILVDLGITTITVTHDQQEAFALGERIGVMAEGRILQWDTPFNLYYRPANRQVANFIGKGQFIKGILRTPDTIETEAGIIKGTERIEWPKGQEMDVFLRPPDTIPDPQSELRGEVLRKAFTGSAILYTLRLPQGNTVLSLFPQHQNHRIGEWVGIRITPRHLVAFPHSS